VSPCCAVPEIAGAAELLGGSGVTTAVADEGAVALPPEFVAVTTTSTVWPTSLEAATYVLAVAPEMSAQLPPDELQSCHW
jgi:hypothetical protein